eukprot:CAMPEP_0170165734 /NCGR_PEP_ID=MMETSP0033_2-20121228/78756_1 /TAXON_ID=195969 /ORGANISM="Dolichomastix tenuilepis, Strain CCMP3274" /LENGTH=511 /DNA_ID=CAMNT_0010403385 /DNA_START=127 /DNA_END=1662 /DNA_ORIENTATION=-
MAQRTALHLALQNGRDSEVASLLASGADPNAVEPGEEVTPLHLGAKHGRLEAVKALCEHAGRNLSLDELDGGNETATYRALEAGEVAVAEYLVLARGATRPRPERVPEAMRQRCAELQAKAEAQALEHGFVMNAEVELHGLKAAAEHNGKHATVIAFVGASQRYRVRLPPPPGAISGGKELDVRSENLRVVVPSVAPPADEQSEPLNTEEWGAKAMALRRLRAAAVAAGVDVESNGKRKRDEQEKLLKKALTKAVIPRRADAAKLLKPLADAGHAKAVELRCDLFIAQQQASLALKEADKLDELVKAGEAKLSGVALLSRAYALHAQGHLSAVEALCARATPDEAADCEKLRELALAPEQREATRLKDLGNAAFGQAQFKDARQHYAEALRLWTDNASLYSNLSGCHTQLGAFREAEKAARRAIELKTDWWKGYSRLASALQGQKRWDDAEAAFAQGLRVVAPNDRAALISADAALRQARALEDRAAAQRTREALASAFTTNANKRKKWGA